MASDVQGNLIEVGGVRTFYVRRGTGHPIILVHGDSSGICASVGWKRNIEPLARAGLTVIAPIN